MPNPNLTVVIAGPAGAGKTHLAQAIGRFLLESGANARLIDDGFVRPIWQESITFAGVDIAIHTKETDV